MDGWTDEMRAAVTTAWKQEASAAMSVFAAARHMIEKPEEADLGLLLRAFLQGAARHVDVEFYRLRQLIDEVGMKAGYLRADQSFFSTDWTAHPDTIAAFCPDLMDGLYEARQNNGLATTEILEWCPNECMDFALPASLAGFMRRPRRLPFRAYATDDAVAYVHPLRYQVLSRDQKAMWVTASPRALGRPLIAEAEQKSVNRTVVIVQDRFGFANFCHFLFDAVTRIFHYVRHFGYTDEVFVMGGVPNEYQRIVGTALCSATGIPLSSLWFPDRAYLLHGLRKCIWFSDQKELHTHPAQMAHPTSLSLICDVASLVPGTNEATKKLYISRGDADRRRISNESDLIAALEAHGFTAVQLAKIPVEQQIGLFRSAEIVVAPHGMGLTHIAMSERLGRVIELFHPTAGTDAYAYIARSSGMRYDHILGKDIPGTHSDFNIDPQTVLDVIGPAGALARRANWHKAANLIPGSRSFVNFQGGSQDYPKDWLQRDFAPMIADQEVRVHRKAAPATNTYSGGWSSIPIAPKTLYVLSCWVWLPVHLPVNEVSIRISGWKLEKIVPADLARPCVWQRISFAAISPAHADQCEIGVHIVGHDGATVATTCWQLERGVNPSAYLSPN